MKYLLYFSLLISTSLHASRLEDIEDTLDQIQLNLMQKQLFDLMDKQNREQIEYEKRNKPKPLVSEFISTRSYIKKYDKVFVNDDKKIHAIKVDSIKKLNDNLVIFTDIIEWNYPQYAENKKPYFGMMSISVFGCRSKTNSMMANILYDMKLNIVDQVEWPAHSNKIPERYLNPNTLMGKQFSYICSGILNN